MEEGRYFLLRSTAPVMQGFILNVPRDGEHPKEKTSVGSLQQTDEWFSISLTHRPVKQQLDFRLEFQVVSAVWSREL
jgi:hypothetical protein